jgi:hypothetical protein
VITLTLTDAQVADLRRQLATGPDVPAILQPVQPVVPPIAQPQPQAHPSGTNYPLIVPESGNWDRYIGMTPGGEAVGTFTMPDAQQVNIGFQRVANASILRTFTLFVNSAQVAETQGKSVMFTLGPQQAMRAERNDYIELWVRNRVGSTPTGGVGSSDGFFQIQRPG